MTQTQLPADKPGKIRKLLPLLSGALVVAVLAGALVFSISARGGADAASAAVNGNTIASIAKGQIGGHCANYYGCKDPGEWCSDFSIWVWSHAGASTAGLTPASGSFYTYGQKHGTLSKTPKIGDAVVFNYGYQGAGTASHVAIVVSINTAAHTITSVGGNERGGGGVVAEDTYNWTVGFSSYWGEPISGYVAPVAGGTPSPVCPATIQNGSSGSLVVTLQTELDSLYSQKKFPNSPYNFKPLLAKDGQFGALTANAVKDFQKAKGLAVDGVVGPQTWHALGHC
jgi:Putative peptidoglycan binding domain/CHAP domain